MAEVSFLVFYRRDDKKLHHDWFTEKKLKEALIKEGHLKELKHLDALPAFMEDFPKKSLCVLSGDIVVPKKKTIVVEYDLQK